MSAELKRSGTKWPGTERGLATTVIEQQRQHSTQTTPYGGANTASILAVPPPPALKPRKETPEGTNRNPTPIKSNPTLINQHMVPTSQSLTQSIVFVELSAWKLYEPIEICYNQGDVSGEYPRLCRLRECSSDSRTKKFATIKDDSLRVIKEHRWSEARAIRHCVKPLSPYLVQLCSAFYQDNIIWIVYEEMETSLHQIFELHDNPWDAGPGQKDNMIASISYQVLEGVQYIHRHFHKAHGAVISQNILLNRSGQVKLGNVATVDPA